MIPVYKEGYFGRTEIDLCEIKFKTWEMQVEVGMRSQTSEF